MKIKKKTYFLLFLVTFGLSGLFMIPAVIDNSLVLTSNTISLEIASFSSFTNATVISDDANYWNTDDSYSPSMVTDSSGNIHVVWFDYTDDNGWGDDPEILYCNYTFANGWSNATVISDDVNGWNDNVSRDPCMAIDDSNNLHVVWQDYTWGAWGTDYEIMYCNFTAANGWSNATVISDDVNGWNIDNSEDPKIAVTGSGTVHVVWADDTNDNWWGTDIEIMYCNYTPASGWSNATVISDDINNWNGEVSYEPQIALDTSGNPHVVWYDNTDGGWWGVDWEIMYCNFTPTNGWSNATVISDDINDWNNGSSWESAIGVDGLDNIHVIWRDATEGAWGNDEEIMYCNFTSVGGWSNATVISDDATTWNNAGSTNPALAIDNSNIIHVVWQDNTDGIWESDREIMYTNCTTTGGWANATVVSDDATLWNDGESYQPSIAVNSSGTVHVTWYDYTDGPWRAGIGDYEIMYCHSIPSNGGGGGGGGDGPPIPGFEFVLILVGFVSITVLYMVKRSRPKDLIKY